MTLNSVLDEIKTAEVTLEARSVRKLTKLCKLEQGNARQDKARRAVMRSCDHVIMRLCDYAIMHHHHASLGP